MGGSYDSRHMWLITVDYVSETNEHVGFCSDGWSDTLEAPHIFRIMDEDENPLYEGKANEHGLMEPFDDFAAPNDVGAKWIAYEVNGNWIKINEEE